ncbi:MAG: DHH family phosphoesterase [Nanoarchaeota archaeon]
MQKRGSDLEVSIKDAVGKFLEIPSGKEILVVSHFDTDGISSAAIMIQALKKTDRRFSVKILKALEKDFIFKIEKDRPVIFLDLASGMLGHIEESGLQKVFIIDHHEIVSKVPKNVTMVNPMMHDKEELSSSGLTYLFCREIDPENKKLAKLAVLGMIGDFMESSIGKLNDGILEDGEIKRKRGLLIYPSTRPINKVLEYSSNPYIPGITGDSLGVTGLLRNAGIEPVNGKYKSIIELDEEEMQRLVTSIILRNPNTKNRAIVGEIFLLKFFNKLEDARELSAMVNACSRLDEPETALQFCMEIPEARKRAESIHVRYKQHLISGLEFVENCEEDEDKIHGKGFLIINARDSIKDTIVGTITSILSTSSLYEEGTIITTMAYYKDKIKISSRNAGRKGRNVREILDSIVREVGGEVGGHEFAAGCLISREQEKNFIEALKKSCEMELVKI